MNNKKHFEWFLTFLFNPGLISLEELSLGSTITLQLVGDDDTRIKATGLSSLRKNFSASFKFETTPQIPGSYGGG